MESAKRKQVTATGIVSEQVELLDQLNRDRVRSRGRETGLTGATSS